MPTAWEWITGAFQKRRCPSMKCSPTPRWTTSKRTIILLISFPTALPWIWASSSSAPRLARSRLRMRRPLHQRLPPIATDICPTARCRIPRSSFPTERFSFQSTYIKNFSMTGSAGYSSGNNTVTGFNEAINGWASRTVTRGGTTGGPAEAKRISVNANWSGDYRLTDKLNIVDEFRYDNWRIPSMWATAETNLFATPPGAGQTGLLLPISTVTPATFATVCPTAPYNGPLCPQHNSSSGADVTNELVSQFLGQNIRSNTIELKYDFTRRVSAYVGYMYTARTIADFSATFDTGEIYFPGGRHAAPRRMISSPRAAIAHWLRALCLPAAR